jgi:FlaA1/EpsC-like NDP-sugar epimerase
VLGGLVQYGAGFLAEVALFWLVLAAFQIWVSRDIVNWSTMIFAGVPLVVVAMGAAEFTFRLYRRVWSVAGLVDALAISAGVVEACIVLTIVNAILPVTIRPYPRLVAVFAAPAVAAAITLFWLLPSLRWPGPRSGNRLLIVASDSQSYPAVKALIQQRTAGWAPVAIVTTNGDLGRTVLSVPVIGHADQLKYWLDVVHPEGVAFVSSRGQGPNRELLMTCLNAELPVFMVAAPEEWLHGRNGTLRQLSADDLVGRSAATLDFELSRRFVEGRTILVTGAAGSIGAELCRCLSTLQPRRLVLLDNDESGLFDIVEELQASTRTEIRAALASIVDRDQVLAVFNDERPSIVFHAAAYKHVPMLESHPVQAVQTNVIGTANVVACAGAVGCDAFVLVSTDKAAGPQSIMGSSKRLCELLVLSQPGPLRAWGVRFGNVVGSRGSVVPLFEQQIAQGGPVTITDAQATRYMMTKREAAALIITTLELAGTNQLFMLDMGEPIKILELAELLIRSRGLRPGTDIEIVFKGLRPGEALTEQLLGPDEAWRDTTHPAIHEVVSATERIAAADLAREVETLRRLVGNGRVDALVEALRGAMTMAGAAEVAAVQPEVASRVS